MFRIIIQPIICMTSYFNGWDSCLTVLLEKCWFLPGHTVRLYKVHQELCSKCWAAKVTASLGTWEKNLYRLHGNTSFSSLPPLLSLLSLSCQWHTIVWQFSLFHAMDWFCFVNHKVSLAGRVPYISQCNLSQYINTSDFLGGFLFNYHTCHPFI